MKKKAVLHILVFMGIVLLSIPLISCLNENYDPVPVKTDDVNGSYRARIVISQGGIYNEKITDFAAKDSVITFSDFPVKEIVKNIVKDPVKAEAVLADLDKIEYKLNFKPRLNAAQNIVELTFEPEALTFQIVPDGVPKIVSVKMTAKKKGFFVGYDHSLRFAWEAEKITVESVDLTPYQTIKYEIPISIKN